MKRISNKLVIALLVFILTFILSTIAFASDKENPPPLSVGNEEEI